MRYADCLLHVVDASYEHYDRQMIAVFEVLGEIGAGDKPRIDVLNKCDLLDAEAIQTSLARRPGAIAFSARDGRGEEELRAAIEAAALRNTVTVTLRIPFADGKAAQSLRERGKVVSEEYCEDGLVVTARLREQDVAVFERYATQGGKPERGQPPRG